MLGTVASAGLLAGFLATSVDAAQPTPLAELIQNGDFESGETEPWWWTEANPASVVDGQLCADNGTDTTYPWDAYVGQGGLALTAGTSYTLTYTASTTSDLPVTTVVQESVDPWTQVSVSNDALTAEPQTFTHEFTPTEDFADAQLVFAFGGGTEELTFCVDDVSLTDGDGGGDAEGAAGGDAEGAAGGDAEGAAGGDAEGAAGGDTEGTTEGDTDGGLIEGLVEGLIGGDAPRR